MVNAGKCEKIEVELTVREAALKLHDEKLLLKIGNYQFGQGQDFIALEAHCHHQCKRNYLNKQRCITKDSINY